MPQDFMLPDIGEGLTEAEVVAWFVEVGQEVAIGETIVEVETAKTTVEIPSPYAGVVTARLAEEGDTVAVGAVLFVIDVPDSDTGTSAPEADPGHDVEAATPATRTAPEEPTVDRVAGIRAVPAVRRLANELGLDLSTVAGSGPGGAITREDVEAASAGGPRDTSVPMSGVRRSIAAHMTESWSTIPHVTVQAEVRAEAILAHLEQGISVEATIADAVLPLLLEFPEFNSRYETDTIVHRGSRNLGFAVDTDAGLMVGVVPDADRLSPAELATEIDRVQGKARTGDLALGEATGQTFTISNIGALGGGHGTPIIPLGTSAIVSIGRAVEQPVVEAGAIEVGMVAPLDVSYDHRIIDGGLGQRFLAALVKRLEDA